ncbi:phage tail protein [Pasteurella canis]|uniref:phage tail protein n=1 Tax=Pasteurella canis TaxID=753 RepID=UPI001D11AD38|nr:phage tail protein [Pasteurella canis]UDW84634.1 phage tail protein [Pasteurella canis]
MSINNKNQPAIPNVPNSLPPDVRQFLEAIRTSIQTFQGGRNVNAELDRAVTLADLKNGKVQLNQSNVIDALTGEGKKGSDGLPHGKAPKKIPNLFDAPIDTPTQPQDFAADVGLRSVILTWARPNYRGHSFTEIFRQRTELNERGEPIDPPSLDLAQHIHAHTVGTVFSDPIEPKTGYYYWIRHINAKNGAGSISSDLGLYVKSDASIKDQLAREGMSLVMNVESTPSVHIGSDIIFNTTLKKLMYWNGSQYGFELPPNSVTENMLAADSVTAGKIAAGTIGAGHLLADAVTTEKLAAGAITAEKISVDKLSALSSNLGNIDGGSIDINGRFIVRSDGTTELRSSTHNIGQVIDNDRTAVYDEAGRLMVEVGLLSYE